MSGKRKGLGRGLNTLIPSAPIPDAKMEDIAEMTKQKSEYPEMTLSINEIEPNPDQPRNQFDEDSLQELADSIQQYGVLQPLLVKKKDGYYEIIAGERRWRAAKIAGVDKVPVIVRDFDENEIVEIALIENVQRENLTAIEEAEAYHTLLEMTGMTQAQLAMRVGKTQSTIANKMRLLKLPDTVKEALRERKITERHARAMLSMQDAKEMTDLTQQVIDEKLTVSQTEKIIAKKKPPKAKTKMRVITQNVRIAINTIHQALEMIRKTGIEVDMEEEDQEDFYVMTLKIQKHKKGKKN